MSLPCDWRVSSIFLVELFFFFYCSCTHPELHSFPTRRSSDLSAILNFLDESPERKTSFIEISRGGKLPYKTGSPAISDRKSGSAGMPRPISYAVFCLKKKKKRKVTRENRQSIKKSGNQDEIMRT